MLGESQGARKRRDTGCLSRPQEDSALPTPRFLTSGSQSCAGRISALPAPVILVKQHTAAFWTRGRSASFSVRAAYRGQPALSTASPAPGGGSPAVTGVNRAPVAQLLSWIWRFLQSHWAANKVGSWRGSSRSAASPRPLPGTPARSQAPRQAQPLSSGCRGRPGAPACFHPSSRPALNPRHPERLGKAWLPLLLDLPRPPEAEPRPTPHFPLLPLEGQKEASEGSK